MKFTLYESAKKNTGTVIDQTWEEWVEAFSRHETRGYPDNVNNPRMLKYYKDGPAVVLGEIPDGETRAKKNVVALHAIGLDFDSASEDELVDALTELDAYAFAAWTTHKHGSDFAPHPRIRVVIPFAKPVSPEQWPEVYARVRRLVRNLNDDAAKDVARLHYTPSTFDERLAEAWSNDGVFLDPMTLPAAGLELMEEYGSLADGDAFTSFEFEDARNQLRNISKHSKKHSDEVKAAMARLADFQPFAEEGGRHDMARAITWWMAKQTEYNSARVAQIFGPSCDVMDYDIETVVRAYEDATVKVAVEQQKQRQKKKEAALAAQAEENGRYSDTELTNIAAKLGVTPEQLERLWIISAKGMFWFLDHNAEYVGPFQSGEANTAVGYHLRKAPARLVDLTQNGIKHRSITDIFREHGTPALNTYAHLAAQRTYLDTEKNTIVESVTPVQDIKPRYHEEIDRWLKLLGAAQYDKLLDWMACAPDLNKLVCAIYFSGPPSVGKTLFAKGISKIWTDGPPCELDDVLGGFNEDLTRCPLILGDEEIAEKRTGPSMTAQLRTLISTDERSLKRKGIKTVPLKGAVRIILTANREDMLRMPPSATLEDLEAVAQRFLFIKPLESAAERLQAHSRTELYEWGHHKIAEHALWLSENRKVETDGRLWVQGNRTEMHQLLLTTSHWNSLVCEWLVRYLQNPGKFDNNPQCSGLILSGSQGHPGQLLVNNQAVADQWPIYLPHNREDPQASKIGQAMRALKISSQRLPVAGKKIWYTEIDLDILCAWAERNNFSTREIIMQAVNRPTYDKDRKVVDIFGEKREES